MFDGQGVDGQGVDGPEVDGPEVDGPEVDGPGVNPQVVVGPGGTLYIRDKAGNSGIR
jgi:hypothetical protein